MPYYPTRQEAFRLSMYYLEEAVKFHESTDPQFSSNVEQNARRAANAIELSKLYFLIKDDLFDPEEEERQYRLLTSDCSTDKDKG